MRILLSPILLSLVALVLLAPGSARAQDVIVSAGPDSVSVTLYRDPNRDKEERISRGSPQGFALVTEERRIHLPAGHSTLRFEGVAGGIFAESAILRGLPAEARERNLDADLLSPRSLFDRALGRQVMIVRTDPATGKQTEQQAVARSSPAGGLVVQFPGGIEALHCSGLHQKIVYPEIPPGLSAKPTLSIEIDSPAAADATLTLSYLAGGFDWQADYVVTMRNDGQGADLFAWITLASADVTSFVDAATQVVAGKLNREYRASNPATRSWIDLQCWPEAEFDADEARSAGGMRPPPPAPAPMAMAMRSMDIVVTSARKAAQEELGDLKLYRIEDRVTVAAKAQKQVAMLAKDSIPFAATYVSDVWNGQAGDPELTLRGRNRTDSGLGVPLPAGQVTVFEDGGGRQVLAGEASLDDKAIGEDVEFKLGDRPGVSATSEKSRAKGNSGNYLLTVTNANRWAVRYEAKFHLNDGERLGAAAKLGKRDGLQIWSAEIPANGSSTLTYRIKR
ncbi:DUF4139 domain-containing protein [soil metagenome]